MRPHVKGHRDTTQRKFKSYLLCPVGGRHEQMASVETKSYPIGQVFQTNNFSSGDMRMATQNGIRQ